MSHSTRARNSSSLFEKLGAPIKASITDKVSQCITMHHMRLDKDVVGKDAPVVGVDMPILKQRRSSRLTSSHQGEG